MTMSKNDVVKKLAADSGATPDQARKMLDSLRGIVLDQVNSGEKLNIPTLGTFSPKSTAARVGRNPQTGQNQDYPAKNTIRFRPSSDFQAAISQPVS